MNKYELYGKFIAKQVKEGETSLVSPKIEPIEKEFLEEGRLPKWANEPDFKPQTIERGAPGTYSKSTGQPDRRTKYKHSMGPLGSVSYREQRPSSMRKLQQAYKSNKEALEWTNTSNDFSADKKKKYKKQIQNRLRQIQRQINHLKKHPSEARKRSKWETIERNYNKEHMQEEFLDEGIKRKFINWWNKKERVAAHLSKLDRKIGKIRRERDQYGVDKDTPQYFDNDSIEIDQKNWMKKHNTLSRWIMAKHDAQMRTGIYRPKKDSMAWGGRSGKWLGGKNEVKENVNSDYERVVKREKNRLIKKNRKLES